MREFGSPSLSLSGSLLIAHPGLLDPNFHRRVLFISRHDTQEGSFGLVLNRPAGRTVGELLDEPQLGSLARIPVFIGGPVAPDQLLFASFRWHDATRTMECQPHLVIDEAREASHDEHLVVRAFIGYAGWSRGQLESELAGRSWLVQKPEPSVLDLERCPQLWREVTSSFGPWYRLVAEAPDDLSLN